MGKLSIVSTPIGNLEDITIRAIKTLSSVDFILCEDTRHTGLLLQKLKIHTKLMPYYDKIEDKRIPEVIELLTQGKNLALVSDAGTPLISDPGFRLVRECIKRRIKVESIPGSSAVLAALTSSGLPTDNFMFLGYPPEKHSARIKQFKNLTYMNRFMYVTYVYYCAPHKLITTLEDLKTAVGDIEIVIARELTKIHEEIWLGTILEALSHFANPQGEFVLLVNIPQA
jgi:16S rRNA (cytidine1402-2'-O)-methyltransferase